MHNTSTEYEQMHNQIISWNDNWILIFIRFVGRLLSASSSSSFITTPFLIQMLRWIKGSSRVESFIFLIAWGIFFESWNIYLQLLPSSFTATSCSLIWETLVKYDCMVFAFWIFTFFNWFLKVIFWFLFFPSNSLVKESNIFDVFKEETCCTSLFVTESTMIFLALTKFFLCKDFIPVSLWNWNLSTYVGVQFISFKRDHILPCLEVVNFTKLTIKLMW